MNNEKKLRQTQASYELGKDMARPAGRLSRTAAATGALAALLAGPAQAAIVVSGDVNPADPEVWADIPIIAVGQTADGAVSVNAGSSVGLVFSDYVNTHLGNASGVTGTLSVDGAGSTWYGFNAATGIYAGAGAGGTGIINITNGGTIRNAFMALGSANHATGILNITNGGIYEIQDGSASIGAAGGATGIALVDGPGSKLGTSAEGLILVGQSGTGLLTVTNGGSVASFQGSVGGSGTGRVILDGPGSTWFIGEAGLAVGNGLITVTSGALLSVSSVDDPSLGVFAGSQGTVIVNGAGSRWNNGGQSVYVGQGGTGRLAVSDGGAFTATDLIIDNLSLVTTDVGTGSSVAVNRIDNDGTVRLVAGAGAADGTYTPIVAGTWTGTGTLQALGGVYNPVTHAVTVSTAATGTAGIATTIDLSATQRLLITDPDTGQTAGASFQATDTPTTLSVTASLMDGSQVNELQGLLDPGKTVLSAWDFSATGHAPGDPVYLSFGVGEGQRFLDLAIWHFDGTAWNRYLNADLAYDNRFASFVATDLGGYAVSGVVPVPPAVWLFGTGLAAIVGLARRKKGPVSA
jgi:T5SS/PEP-CTERM-associated repeat protein